MRKPIRKRNNKLAIIDGIWKTIMDKSGRDFSNQVEISYSSPDFLLRVEIFQFKSRFIISVGDLFFMSGCSNSSRHFSIQGAGRDVTQDSFLAFSAKDKNLKMT